MVDNRSTVNIILLRTLLLVGLTVDHLKHSSAVIQGFDQSEQRPLEKIAIKSLLRIRRLQKVYDHQSGYIVHCILRSAMDAQKCDCLLYVPPMCQIPTTGDTRNHNGGQ